MGRRKEGEVHISFDAHDAHTHTHRVRRGLAVATVPTSSTRGKAVGAKQAPTMLALTPGQHSSRNILFICASKYHRHRDAKWQRRGWTLEWRRQAPSTTRAHLHTHTRLRPSCAPPRPLVVVVSSGAALPMYPRRGSASAIDTSTLALTSPHSFHRRFERG